MLTRVPRNFITGINVYHIQNINTTFVETQLKYHIQNISIKGNQTITPIVLRCNYTLLTKYELQKQNMNQMFI